MLVGEPRFAAQLRTHDGERRYFDDPGCLLLHLAQHPRVAQQSWVRHLHEERWLALAAAGFVPASPSPMAYGFGAVAHDAPGAVTPKAALQQIHAHHPNATHDARHSDADATTNARRHTDTGAATNAQRADTSATQNARRPGAAHDARHTDTGAATNAHRADTGATQDEHRSGAAHDAQHSDTSATTNANRADTDATQDAQRTDTGAAADSP